MRRGIPLPARAPIVALAAVALATGVLGGLVRAGVGIELPAAVIVGHGPLVAVGFFGTLIGLERAVAVGHPIALVPAVLAASSGVALLVGEPVIAAVLATGSGVAAFVLHAWLLARTRTLDLAMLTLGALGFAAGNAAWLAGRPWGEASLGWAAFLVLTIVGERLEMTRLLPPRRGRGPALAIAVLLFVGASALSLFDPALGAPLRAVALTTMGVWLLAYDAVLRVRTAGSQYVKTALTLGHAWLVVAGPLTFLAGGALAGLRYDAALHSLYVGFVLGMVFAHAPIVLGSVLKLRLAPSPWLHVPLVLLHGANATRVLGDLIEEPGLRRLGALATALALVAFAGTLGVSILAQRRARGHATDERAITAPPSTTRRSS